LRGLIAPTPLRTLWTVQTTVLRHPTDVIQCSVDARECSDQPQQSQQPEDTDLASYRD